MTPLVTKQGTRVAEIDAKGRLIEGMARASAHLKWNIPLFVAGKDEPVDLKQILIDTESA